ncbi:MAG TPA: adaptor protein MecA [Terriglobales bacterium]|nr:adaptor protein MecA [Candidatus Acidoferrum sp.]HWQ51813.1 adaptor protein MecA [Terriglobales bacterium]
MKIEVVGENRLRLLLDGTDMAEYGLTYEDIDYSRPQTQKAFRNMMDRAEDAVGFRSDGYKLVIEARPATDGGCVLTVTRRPKKKERDPLRRGTRATFLFDTADDALDARLALSAPAAIMRVGRGYVLTVDPAGEPQRNILLEFGREIDA